MEPLKPEVKERILRERHDVSRAEIREYETLLSQRFAAGYPCLNQGELPAGQPVGLREPGTQNRGIASKTLWLKRELRASRPFTL